MEDVENEVNYTYEALGAVRRYGVITWGSVFVLVTGTMIVEMWWFLGEFLNWIENEWTENI